MKLLYTLIDDVYPSCGYTHTRDISRAVLLNGKNEVCLNYLLLDDSFGHRDYYELPGGGKERGETLIQCLKRELKEEVGVIIKDNIIPLGRVVDQYNLIQRINNNHYYLCYVDSYVAKDPNEYEKTYINKQVWVDIDTAIELYESVDINKSPLGKLVVNRELPILKLARDIISKYNINCQKNS
ncbi:MAG: NUDIX hydrolase [Coprobacillus sp.]|nr:NUDIX hydrolase [Coprobacillus sp.]